MKFKKGDEVEIVRLTLNAYQMFKVGDITRILKINTNYRQPYNLECSNPRGWYVHKGDIKLRSISLENV